MTLLMASNIILEAFVSFLNFGISETQVTWGNSLSNAQNALLTRQLVVGLLPGHGHRPDRHRHQLHRRRAARRARPAHPGVSRWLTIAATLDATPPSGRRRRRCSRCAICAPTSTSWTARCGPSTASTFSIGAAGRSGVVGESGCGKSVTALTIMRLLDIPPAEIASGEILFEGRDLLTLTEDEHPQAARQRDGHDLPGAHDQPEPGLHASATRSPRPIRHHLDVTKQEAARARRRGARPGRHPRTRSGAPASIRTSSPAACASAS